MSLPTNFDATMTEKPILQTTTTTTIPSDASLNRVSSTDSSISSQFSDAPSRVENVLKAAADLSPEAVTSPLEALALACFAEKATTEEQQQGQESTTKKPEFTDNDVLCGRGGLTNNARGNIYFRHLVRQKQESYLLATKREKAGVAREIVASIRSLNPPGRFLKKDSKTGEWVEIGERKAREKTSQALREGAPEKRAELHPPPAAPPAVIPTTTTNTLQGPLPMYAAPSPWMPSNRARVVSDDSVGMNASLTQEAAASSGSKRKATMGESSPLRGPRLKLLKTRLMN